MTDEIDSESLKWRDAYIILQKMFRFNAAQSRSILDHLEYYPDKEVEISRRVYLGIEDGRYHIFSKHYA